MVGRIVSSLAVLGLLLFGAVPVLAAPADLDRSFGGDGTVPIEGPGGVTFPADASARMVVGPDDETLVLFSNYACPNEWECPTELTLARYDSGGSRDLSFGAQLQVQEGPERRPFDLAVGSDGKAVVAAYDSSAGEEGSLRVFRFDRAGHLDPTFGGTGETPQPLRPGHSAPVAVAVQPDGKVVVTTEGSRVDAGQELRVARYLTTGPLDPGFGAGGEARLTLPTQARPADVLLGPTGAVTVASPYCCVGGTALFGDGFSVARLLGDGQPDTGLAGSGQLLFPTPGAQGAVTAMAPAVDGGAYILFEERTEAVSTVGNLIKLAPDGSLDSAFGNAGRLRVFYRVGGVDPTAIAVDGKGRLVGAGGDGDTVAAFRLRPDGSTDRTFNGGQRVTARGGSTALAMALQSSGRIVVLGRSGCCRALGFSLLAFRGGTDRSRCLGRKATIVGTRKADELTGTSRRDVIAALGGKDKVRGLSGPDVICGGRGQDKLLGGPGRDEVRQ